MAGGAAGGTRRWWPAGREHHLAVTCPGCGAPELTARFSCLATEIICPQCRRVYDLAELHRCLDDGELDLLAALVEDRHSDRV